MIAKGEGRSTDETWDNREWKYAVVTYLVIFIVIWAMMLLTHRIYSGSLAPDEIYRPYQGVLPEQSSFLEVWQRWDTLHYQAIAERGYTAFESALFVPPLYPLLMRGLGSLLGGKTLLAGLILSNIFGVAALMAFQRLVVYEFGSLKVGRRAVLYYLSFPTAFFIFAAYTESLFLLGAILSLFYLRREKYVAAGIWGAVAALARLPGALLVLPAAYAAWMAWQKKKVFRVWAAPLLISVGAAILPLYAWLGLGLSPFAPITTQSGRFHGGLTVPGWNLIMAVKQIAAGVYPITNSLDLFFTLLFIVGTFYVVKKMPKLYAIYVLSFMALYLFRIAAVYPLLSNSRYMLILFPVFMLMAQEGEKPWGNRLILYPSWIGLLYLSGQFAIWGWVG